RLRESVAHDLVRRLLVLRACRAPIIFQIVNAPRGVLARVLKFVAATARSLLAGERSGVRVESELESLRVHVVGERLYPRREALRVGDDVAFGVAANLPAVVNDYVTVSG